MFIAAGVFEGVSSSRRLLLESVAEARFFNAQHVWTFNFTLASKRYLVTGAWVSGQFLLLRLM